MKILQINAVNVWGSTGRNVVELSMFLKNMGHNNYIVHSTGPFYENSYRIGNKLDRNLHAILSRLFGLQAYFSTFETHKLLHFVDKLRPDIVHLNNLHSNFINLPLLLKYLAKNDIATVVTLHDCWFFTGKCMHYTSNECDKWQKVCGHCSQLKEGNRSWFFDRTAKMLKDKRKYFTAIPRLAVVGVSDWITNEARKSILKDAKIVKRIYNWIDLDIFKPMDSTKLRNNLELQDKFVLLGVTGAWSYGDRKGLDVFLKLSKIISADMQIILVGRIDENVVLPANVLGVGATDNVDELVKYYSLADVFVNLSKEETFGKVTAEALACGTPIITNQYTANPELIDKTCGIVVDKLSIEKILGAINTIKQKGKQFYASNCRNHAKENFNKKYLIRDYVQVYTEILEYRSKKQIKERI